MTINEQEKPKKSNFIFGDLFGRWMSNISLRTQYEGTMLGCTFILLALIWFIINWIFFSPVMTWGWKVFYIANALCGMMILWSQVITTFQQYQSFMEISAVTNLIKNEKGGREKW